MGFQPFSVLRSLLGLLEILIVIRILMTWISPRSNPYEQPMKFLYAVTEPIMAPFRALIPPVGGIDFSPMLLFILIGLLQSFLTTLF